MSRRTKTATYYGAAIVVSVVSVLFTVPTTTAGYTASQSGKADITFDIPDLPPQVSEVVDPRPDGRDDVAPKSVNVFDEPSQPDSTPEHALPEESPPDTSHLEVIQPEAPLTEVLPQPDEKDNTLEEAP